MPHGVTNNNNNNNKNKIIFIGVQLIYNVVLVSAVQQSESVIHIHISTLLDSFPM